MVPFLQRNKQFNQIVNETLTTWVDAFSKQNVRMERLGFCYRNYDSDTFLTNENAPNVSFISMLR